MSRCMACNEIMTEKEIIWDEERQEHEEFCTSCRTKMYDSLMPEYVNIVELGDDTEEG